jgi:uncharacterized protein
MTAKTKYGFIKPVAFSVMLKPNGPSCNLGCNYCYYLEKENLFASNKQMIMSEAVLESFTRQFCEANQVPVIQFVFQGGEPTLLGIPYFEKALAIQKKYAGNKQIENVLQTNGTLLNDEWCAFLKENNFLVGISVDGPEDIHNTYRKTKNGKATFDLVMRGIELLKKHQVEFNTLTVINNENVKDPLTIYNFLKKHGSGYMQFLPVVERIACNHELLNLVSPDYNNKANIAPWSVNPNDFGHFLNIIFDEWVKQDVGKYYVQHFDVALANWVSAMPGLCVYCDMCGDALVMEYNGDIYSCDHFVYPQYRLGNILEDSLLSLVRSDKQIQFGKNKKDTLPTQCIECEYRFACNGGCLKHRFNATTQGESNLNYLCEGYLDFFNHIHPYMQYMADELKKERPPANVMQWIRDKNVAQAKTKIQNTIPIAKIGRNDHCFCGSGKKFKQCHGKN